MFARAICKKCHCTGVVDLEEHTVEEAKTLLGTLDFGECPFGGFHVEQSKIDRYVIVDYSSLSKTQEEAETKIMIKSLKDYGFGKRVSIITTDEQRDVIFMYWSGDISNPNSIKLTMLNEDNKKETIRFRNILTINNEVPNLKSA